MYYIYVDLIFSYILILYNIFSNLYIPIGRKQNAYNT